MVKGNKRLNKSEDFMSSSDDSSSISDDIIICEDSTDCIANEDFIIDSDDDTTTATAIAAPATTIAPVEVATVVCEQLVTPSIEQVQILAELEGKNVIVNAVAGSGKTTTILHIAKMFPSLKILVVTYSARLKIETKVRASLYGLNNLDVYSYHSFCVRHYNKKCYTDSEIIKLLLGMDYIKNNFGYDMIIIDEAQDMTNIYFELIHKICLEQRKVVTFCILGDQKQNIFTYACADYRYITMADKIFTSHKEWTKLQLSTSYRLTNQMSRFINECIYRQTVIRTVRNGPMVDYLMCNGFGNKIYLLLKKYLQIYDCSDIFILAPSLKQNGGKCSPVLQLANSLTKDGIPIYVPGRDDYNLDEKVLEGKIVFSSFHQVKGLERKLVFVFSFDNSYFDFYDRTGNRKECPNTIYVAITRAKEKLVLIHDTKNNYFEFLDDTKLPSVTNYMYEELQIESIVRKRVIDIPATHITDHLSAVTIDRAIKYINVEKINGKGDIIAINTVTEQDNLFEDVAEITGTAIPSHFEFSNVHKLNILENIITRTNNDAKANVAVLLSNNQGCEQKKNADQITKNNKYRSCLKQIFSENDKVMELLRKIFFEPTDYIKRMKKRHFLSSNTNCYRIWYDNICYCYESKSSFDAYLKKIGFGSDVVEIVSGHRSTNPADTFMITKSGFLTVIQKNARPNVLVAALEKIKKRHTVDKNRVKIFNHLSNIPFCDAFDKIFFEEKFYTNFIARLACVRVSPDLFLKISNIYCSLMSKYDFKLSQIKDFSWLSTKNVRKCKARLETHLGKNTKHEIMVEYQSDKVLPNNFLVVTGAIDCIDKDKNNIWEFKCTKELSQTHILQLAIYAYMYAVAKEAKYDKQECKLIKAQNSHIFAPGDVIITNGNEGIIVAINGGNLIISQQGMKRERIISRDNVTLSAHHTAITKVTNKRAKQYNYYLLNILTNELHKISAPFEKLKDMFEFLIREKYSYKRVIADDEFLAVTQQIKDKYANVHASTGTNTIVLDIETDGGSNIIEIAYKIYDSNDKLIKERDIFINDGTDKVDYYAMIPLERIHRDGVPPLEAISEVSKDFATCKYIIGHNISFDVKHIMAYCFKYGCRVYRLEQIDTMHISKAFVKLKNKKGGLKSPKLSELYHYLFKVAPDTTKCHTALYDVEITRACFKELVRRRMYVNAAFKS